MINYLSSDNTGLCREKFKTVSQKIDVCRHPSLPQTPRSIVPKNTAKAGRLFRPSALGLGTSKSSKDAPANKAYIPQPAFFGESSPGLPRF